MDTLSPMILLHENGYKALARSDDGDDLGRVVLELQGKTPSTQPREPARGLDSHRLDESPKNITPGLK
jgi:hypothetical protein